MRPILFCALVASAAAPSNGQPLYALTDYIFPQLVQVDTVTGSVTSSVPVSGHESLFGGLEFVAGDLYSIDGYNDPNSDRTFRINAATGAGVVVGPTGFNWNFRTLAHRPAAPAALYAATDNQLFTINTTTGAASFVANITAASALDQLTALAINAQGQAFITDIGETSLFSLNLQTGQATFIAHVGQTGNWFEDLTFDDAGVLWGCRLNGGVYTINTATGAETFRFAGFYKGFEFDPGGCYPDCNNDGALTVQDFGCFQTAFVSGNLYADCNNDGLLTVPDFGCFQTSFVAGCP